MRAQGFVKKDQILCSLITVLLLASAVLSWRLVFAQPLGTLNGKVFNLKSSLGVGGATVSASGPSQRSTTTDANGNYSISGLAPGPYTIIVSVTGYVTQSTTLFVHVGTNHLDFGLHLLSVIGRVYDASSPDAGISEANVTVGSFSVLTNSTGHYKLLDLSNGTHTVSATAPGYTNQSQAVTVSEGTSTVADFALSQVATGRISGKITDSATRKAVYQAVVRVRRGSFEKLNTTNQNGQYTIENVPAWPFWTVDAYKVGYIAQTTIVGVSSEATTTLNVALTPYGIINGTVKAQATNQPIAGAVVRANSEFINNTNSNGYTIFAVAGTYTVTASAPGYSSQSQSNVKVNEGKATTVNFLLQSVSPGSIIGNVTDAATGNRISGALVTTSVHSSTTDTNGSYILSNIPAWTYTVSVSALGYLEDSTVLTVPSGGFVTANFTLNPNARILLNPYLNFGNPGQSFSVNIDIAEARFLYSWEVYLWWNPTLLNASNVQEGSFLKGPFGNRTTQLSFDRYPDEGVIYVKGWSTLSEPDSGVSGTGTLATITFQIKAKGTCKISITSAMLFDPSGIISLPNAMESAWFRTLQSDINNDGTVGILDLSALAKAYGSKPDAINWNISADVNRDKIISVLDMYRVGKDFGKSV